MIKQAASPGWWKGKDESDTTIAYMCERVSESKKIYKMWQKKVKYHDANQNNGIMQWSLMKQPCKL